MIGKLRADNKERRVRGHAYLSQGFEHQVIIQDSVMHKLNGNRNQQAEIIRTKQLSQLTRHTDLAQPKFEKLNIGSKVQ
jgi:hypothetical protein